MLGLPIASATVVAGSAVTAIWAALSLLLQMLLLVQLLLLLCSCSCLSGFCCMCAVTAVAAAVSPKNAALFEARARNLGVLAASAFMKAQTPCCRHVHPRSSPAA
jgi:hypothetical protein